MFPKFVVDQFDKLEFVNQNSIIYVSSRAVSSLFTYVRVPFSSISCIPIFSITLADALFRQSQCAITL